MVVLFGCLEHKELHNCVGGIFTNTHVVNLPSYQLMQLKKSANIDR